MRANGYYWVKLDGEWIISEWDQKEWYKIGREHYYNDDDFEEIDERRIERDQIIILKKAFDAGANSVTYNGRPGYPYYTGFSEWLKKWKK